MGLYLIQMGVWCASATDVQPRERKTGCAWRDDHESSDASMRQRFRALCPDADLDAAVKAAASGIFFNSGQVCSAGSRILVHADIYDEVVERLVARAQAIRVGDPKDADTSMGPLVSEAQMKRVLDYMRAAS